MKKKSFTLLEVTLAIFLTGLILSTLWQLHYHYYLGYKKVKELQQQVEKKLFLSQKLKNIFFKLGTQEKKAQLITQKNGSLAICYEEITDPSPAFNGSICALLYVDEHKRLCLCNWAKDRSCHRIEILHDEVCDLKLSFFDSDSNNWKPSWDSINEHSALPLWVKMQLSFVREKPESFIFKTTYLNTPISYYSSIQEN